MNTTADLWSAPKCCHWFRRVKIRLLLINECVNLPNTNIYCNGTFRIQLPDNLRKGDKDAGVQDLRYSTSMNPVTMCNRISSCVFVSALAQLQESLHTRKLVTRWITLADYIIVTLDF